MSTPPPILSVWQVMRSVAATEPLLDVFGRLAQPGLGSGLELVAVEGGEFVVRNAEADRVAVALRIPIGSGEPSMWICFGAFAEMSSAVDVLASFGMMARMLVGRRTSCTISS